MKVDAHEAWRRFKELLDRVGLGEDVIVTRRGRIPERLEPMHHADTTPTLPELAAFRASRGTAGEPLSDIVIEERASSRY